MITTGRYHLVAYHIKHGVSWKSLNLIVLLANVCGYAVGNYGVEETDVDTLRQLLGDAASV